MVACESLPISFVEMPTLRELMDLIELGYKVPCRATLMTALRMKFYTAKEELKEEMKQVEDIALTTDCWTSCTQKGYMTITGHYITTSDDLMMKHRSVVLDTMPVMALPPVENAEGEVEAVVEDGPQRHTAQALANQLKVVSKEYGIEKKNTCL